MSRHLIALVATAALWTVTGPAFAHHGTAAFDLAKVVTVKGTVTSFDFANPHCLVHFDVKNDKGEVEQWQAELTAPTKLARGGWSKCFGSLGRVEGQQRERVGICRLRNVGP